MKTKILLIVMALSVPFMAFSQSNTPGTIQLGLGFGVGLGGATFSNTDIPDQSGVGAKFNFGVRGQYGILDNVSAGVFVRTEDAVYAVTDETGDNSSDITFSGVTFGLEGKYYLVNKDRFALYADLGLGLTTGTASNDATDVNGNAIPDVSVSGLNYLVGIGFNFWFADFIGMSLDLGYNGSSVSGTLPGYTIFSGYNVYGNAIYATSPSTTETISASNVTFGLGVITKFGGSGGHSGGGHHHHH